MSSDELPEEVVAQDRRALIIYYDDATNEVEMYADEFGALEIPELLRVALDLAEADLPVPVDYDTEDPE